MRIILGIDPGSRVTGYGLIWTRGSEIGCISYGEIKIQAETLSEKLFHIHEGIAEVIKNFQPHEAAIEEVFMKNNPNSALKLGQARGAALVALATAGLPVSEYSPRKIKKSVVGHGAADKNQIQQMVTLLLKLKQSPKPDAADALAVALCHSYSSRLADKLAEKLQKIA